MVVGNKHGHGVMAVPWWSYTPILPSGSWGHGVMGSWGHGVMGSWGHGVSFGEQAILTADESTPVY